MSEKSKNAEGGEQSPPEAKTQEAPKAPKEGADVDYRRRLHEEARAQKAAAEREQTAQAAKVEERKRQAERTARDAEKASLAALPKLRTGLVHMKAVRTCNAGGIAVYAGQFFVIHESAVKRLVERGDAKRV